MLVTAFRPSNEVFNLPISLWPDNITFDNFGHLFVGAQPIATFFVNSVVTSMAAAILTVMVALPAGYAFARLRFRLRVPLFATFLTAQMIPLILLILPIYAIFVQLHLLNTYAGLVIAYAAFTVPFAVWLMRGFCLTVPLDLEDAAMVDGAGWIATLLYVVVPLLKPAIVAVGAFAFLDAWNNLLFPLVLTTDISMKTLPPGLLLAYAGEFKSDWGGMMAASLVTSLPVIVVFIIVQRYMREGLEGALKG
jgi:multiple sugar transport system permease protein